MGGVMHRPGCWKSVVFSGSCKSFGIANVVSAGAEPGSQGSACHGKMQQVQWLNHTHSLSHSSGGSTSKIKRSRAG